MGTLLLARVTCRTLEWYYPEDEENSLAQLVPTAVPEFHRD
jgi:hypothetical protein